MSSYQKPNYKTTNWPAYNKALKKRGSLTIWLDPSLNWYAPLSGKRGRSAIYTDQAIECCLTIKTLFQLPLHQTIGLLESLFSLLSLIGVEPFWCNYIIHHHNYCSLYLNKRILYNFFIHS